MNLGTFDDGSPIYRQIAEQIKADVLDGTLGPDAQLMSTNQYAAYYRINPATAAKAFQQLVDEGVVYKKRGIGMFVSAAARAQLQQQHRKRFFSDVVDPMIERARAIGIPLDDIVTRIEQREQRKDEERRT